MTSNPTILIIEDEEAIRSFLEDFLNQAGYTVISACEGETALAYIARQTFDLALVDLILPDLPGLKIIHTLHQTAPETAIIALTGWPFSERELAELQPYTYSYLTKPFTISALQKVLQQALRGR